MGPLLLGVLEQLLKLGNLTMEERHLYEDNVLKLKKEWYEEFQKLETDLGSDNALDDIELKLRLTTEALVETLRAKNS
jgi:hypothetical protein